MNMKIKSPMVISVLALALILAGCDRPSAGPILNTPSAQDVGGQPTQSPEEISAQQTADASGQNPPQEPAANPTDTPIPAANPQATSTPISAQPTSAPDNNVAQATPVPTSVTSTGSTGTTYVVQPGDRLFSIGRMFGVNPYAIAQANNIGAPYTIYPGRPLVIPGTSGATPPPSGSNPYVVQPGDNLFRIALRFGRSMQAIAAANGISNYNLIFVGQPLTIP
jgi:LysM repeat protein